MCLNSTESFCLFIISKTNHTSHYILKTRTLIVDVQKNKTAAEKLNILVLIIIIIIIIMIIIIVLIKV